MTTPPPKQPRLRPTVLLPAWGVRALGAILLIGGLILPWWIIKERTRQAADELTTAAMPDLGPLRPEMVLLPVGPLPGSDPAQAPAIRVPFALSVTEVTQGQFQRVMGELPAEGRCAQAGDDPELPVVCVTWFQAMEYCNRLSELEGLAACYKEENGKTTWTGPECQGYRLPTEAEWEYAARAATDFRYAGTDSESEICRYANVADRTWGKEGRFDCEDGHETAAPVGQFQPNAWFLYDMTGNAAEWVWDNNSNDGVLKGGTWSANPESARITDRVTGYSFSSDHWLDFGLRIARSVNPP